MTVGNQVTIAVLAVAFATLMAPAFAQNGSNGMPNQPDHGMSMGHVDRGMKGGGMMSGSMMAGCADMMQSMNNGDNGGPNSQWQKQRRSESN